MYSADPGNVLGPLAGSGVPTCSDEFIVRQSDNPSDQRLGATTPGSVGRVCVHPGL
jgi:hypothetical protein